MRWMGERLAEFGGSVLVIQLSGRTTPEEMAKTCWADWAGDAEGGINELRKTCDIVIGVGLSMGGLLVLHLATLSLIDGLVAMNAGGDQMGASMQLLILTLYARFLTPKAFPCTYLLRHYLKPLLSLHFSPISKP